MPFNHDSFAYRVEILRERGNYERIERTGPDSKGMALVRFLAYQPGVALSLKDGESVDFIDPKTGRRFKITAYHIEL